MIRQTYYCENCNETSSVEIKTWDITGNKGIVDCDKLTERVLDAYNCPRCGGKRGRKFSNIPDVLWFNAGIGKGKISQRFG